MIKIIKPQSMRTCSASFLFASTFVFTCALSVFPLTTHPVTVVVQQNETVQFNPLFKSPDTASDKTIQLAVLAQPKNGTVTVIPDAYKRGSVIVPGFQYAPNTNYVGPDSMEWSAGNSLGSSTGACRIIVQPPEPGGMAVLIYVNDVLYPKLSPEINRLKGDLDGEGYTAKIKLWHNTSTNWTDGASAFHDSIRAEFSLAGGLMAGTIAIGRLPVYYDGGENDSKYWSLSDWTLATDTLVWGNRGRSCRHIWFSRMFGAGTWGAATSLYGAESLLIKRALQANHDYRTGAQRLPHTAWCYPGCNGWKNTSFTTPLSKVWPDIILPDFDPKGVNTCGPLNYLPYIYGGELGDSRPYGWLGQETQDVDILLEGFSPIRVILDNICGKGKAGDFVNMHQFPRNTGNVLAICASMDLYKMGFEDTLIKSYSGPQPYSLCDTIPKTRRLVNLLASGTRWGRAWLQSNMEINHLGIFGDLTLKPNMAPSNQIPIIDSIRADKISGIAPLTVNFWCSARDTDGTPALYEWYPEDYNWGRDEPETSGATQTTCTNTYFKPYHYAARVNVFDNYKAGAYKSIDLFVAPAAGDTLRVRCGNPRPCFQSRYEYTDPQGKRWSHDQVYHSGTWGADTGYGATATGWTTFHTNPGPSDENSFTYMASVPISDTLKSSIGYRVPLPAGQYKIKLGFADWTSAGNCVMNVELNGVIWKEAFSPSALVGAKKNCTIDTTFYFAGGELVFKIKRNAATPTTIILNNFEIHPIGFPTAVNLDPNGRLISQIVVSPNPFSSLTRINVRLNKSTAFIGRGEIKAAILDIRGKTIKRFNLTEASGRPFYQGSFTWDGADLTHKKVSNGLYFFIIKGCGIEMKRSMLLVR